jgi:hypothetical protein
VSVPRFLLWLAGIVFFGATVTTTIPETLSAAESQNAAAPTAQAPSSAYAGTDTCLLCHAEQESSLEGTAHGQALNLRSPAAARGCESCHGPGCGRRREGPHRQVRAAHRARAPLPAVTDPDCDETVTAIVHGVVPGQLTIVSVKALTHTVFRLRNTPLTVLKLVLFSTRLRAA